LELSRPLFYALRYTRGLLGTEVPGQTLMRAEVGRPSRGVLQLMDTLLMRGLRPRHVLCDDWLSAPTLGLLYVRAHWLRMPPLLLARHLLQKAFAKQDET